jgi:hypothetical protein
MAHGEMKCTSVKSKVVPYMSEQPDNGVHCLSSTLYVGFYFLLTFSSFKAFGMVSFPPFQSTISIEITSIDKRRLGCKVNYISRRWKSREYHQS